MERLIDSYQDGYLEKAEFEPRIGGLRERLAQSEALAARAADARQEEAELQSVIDAVEQFAGRVREQLDSSDFATRRDLIRTLVDRIEVDDQEVRIVYKVNVVPFERGPSRGILQHCPSSFPAVGLDLTVGGSGHRCGSGDGPGAQIGEASRAGPSRTRSIPANVPGHKKIAGRTSL